MKSGSAEDTSDEADKTDPRVGAAREALLEGVGAEVAASFPGITRLGGQVVAALYLSDAPRSMDELCAELGRSKSNIFSNLRALEAAGIVARRREPGSRHDSFSLRGRYPDVLVGAYLSRLRRVVRDKQILSRKALAILGDAPGDDAESLRSRLHDLSNKYDLFAQVTDAMLADVDGPVDIAHLLSLVPPEVFGVVQKAAREAFGVGTTNGEADDE